MWGRLVWITAVYITIGPSGAFYTHRRTFSSHPGDGSERFRFGAPLSLLESPLTRHCRRPDITTRVCVKCGRGAYRYENSCKSGLRASSRMVCPDWQIMYLNRDSVRTGRFSWYCPGGRGFQADRLKSRVLEVLMS